MHPLRDPVGFRSINPAGIMLDYVMGPGGLTIVPSHVLEGATVQGNGTGLLPINEPTNPTRGAWQDSQTTLTRGSLRILGKATPTASAQAIFYASPNLTPGTDSLYVTVDATRHFVISLWDASNVLVARVTTDTYISGQPFDIGFVWDSETPILDGWHAFLFINGTEVLTGWSVRPLAPWVATVPEWLGVGVLVGGVPAFLGSLDQYSLTPDVVLGLITEPIIEYSAGYLPGEASAWGRLSVVWAGRTSPLAGAASVDADLWAAWAPASGVAAGAILAPRLTSIWASGAAMPAGATLAPRLTSVWASGSGVTGAASVTADLTP